MKPPAVLAALLFAGCAALPPVPPPEAPIQQCLVCRYQRDFACLEVDKSPATPQTTIAGRTYYFCSAKCRDEFVREPAKYRR